MTNKSAADPPTNVLYVVLHGLVCLIEDPQGGFTAHLIDQGDIHHYKAGTFRLEQTVNENLSLQGIDTPGMASLAQYRDKNAIVKKAKPVNDIISARSKISLPRPNTIYHFVCGDVRGVLLDLDDELLKPLPTVISGTRVFQYSPKDFNSVKLVRADNSVFWPCPASTIVNTPQGDLAVAILEVYNEPPIDLDQILPGAAAVHNLGEFADSLTFMGARSARLILPTAHPRNVDTLPPGLTAQQVCSLDVRDKVSTGRFGKPNDAAGGAGGTQVCGGANGMLG